MELTALVRAHGAALRLHAAMYVGRDAADDAVADAFVVAVRRWHELPESPDERRAWLFGVVGRVARATARRDRGLRVRAAAGAVDLIAADVAESVVERDRAITVLRALPGQSREAILLTVWMGMSVAQAASAAGCSARAMSMRLTRARRLLAEIVARETGAAGDVVAGREPP